VGTPGRDHAGVRNGDDVAAEFVAMVEQEGARFGLPISSSPSNRKIRLTRQLALFSRRVFSTPSTWASIWPLLSVAPRAQILPSRISG
jgi:hypothetical protein